jgi:hypothetical protein
MRKAVSSEKNTTFVFLHKLRVGDICCGRGKGYTNHPGNQRFQEIIQRNLSRYTIAPSKNGKSKVVADIVNTLRNEGARFVKKHTASAKWYDIGLVQAREKTGHAIRDHILNRSKRHAKEAIENSKLASPSSDQACFPTIKELEYGNSILSDSVLDDASIQIDELIDEPLGLRDDTNKPDFVFSVSESLSVLLRPNLILPTALPSAGTEFNFVGASARTKTAERRKQMIGGFIDFLGSESEHHQSQKTSPHHGHHEVAGYHSTILIYHPVYHDLSRQEILEVCSLLAEYEQEPDREERNDNSAALINSLR